MSGVNTPNSIITHRGDFVNPFQPEENVYHIQDIAHALARICRWNGHCRDFYSVAQHSVRLYDALPENSTEELRRRILLHDASEAYLTDLPTPIKKAFPGYKAAEIALSLELYKFFGLSPVHFAHDIIVEMMDKTLAGVEAAQLGLRPGAWLSGAPYELICSLAGDAPRCWTPEEAERQFLSRASECGINTGG